MPDHKSLGDAVVACEKIGLPLSCVRAVPGGYKVEPAKKKRAKKKPAKKPSGEALKAYRGERLTGKKWKDRMSFELGRDMHKRKMKALKTDEEKARAQRRRKLPELREGCEQRRQVVQDDCALARAAIRAEANDTIEGSKDARREARADYARNRRIEGQHIKRESQRSSAKERRSESDDLVSGNVDESLRPVWEKWKGRIKGSPRKTRTEAFLHEVEENPGEVIRLQMLAAGADEEFAAEQAEHYAALVG